MSPIIAPLSPNLNGLALSPIILLTSLNYKEAVPSGLFDEMIYKPVREQRLVDSMMRLLSGRAESPRKSRKPTSELQGPKIKILLAEDNLANQTVVKLMIKQLGIDIDIVGDGGAAVEKIMTRPYARIERLGGLEQELAV